MVVNHGLSVGHELNSGNQIREVTAECRHWKKTVLVLPPLPMSKQAAFRVPLNAVANLQYLRMYHEKPEIREASISGSSANSGRVF